MNHDRWLVSVQRTDLFGLPVSRVHTPRDKKQVVWVDHLLKEQQAKEFGTPIGLRKVEVVRLFCTERCQPSDTSSTSWRAHLVQVPGRDGKAPNGGTGAIVSVMF